MLSSEEIIPLPSIRAATCASLQVGGTTANGTGAIAFGFGTYSLTVLGTVTVGGTFNSSAAGTITLTRATSSMTCDDLVMGNSTVSSSASITMPATSAGTTLTVNHTITVAGSGTRTWTKGMGTVVLTGTSTLPSTVFVDFYNLKIASNTTTLAANTTVSSALEVSAGATLDMNTYSIGTPTSLTLYCGASSSTISGSGTLTLGGNVTVSSSGAGTTGVVMDCPIALGASRTFTIADGGGAESDLTLNGLISGNTFGITKAGPGTLLLSGNNTYSGTTTISAGTLDLGASGSGSYGPLGATGGTTSVTSGACLDLNGFTLVTAESLTLNGTGILSGGALVNSSATPVSWSGTVSLASTSSINSIGQISISGVISGTGGITKIGAEKLVLSGNNSYSGSTTISTGMLQLGGSGSGSNGPLGATGGTTTVASGACLELNGFTLVTAESLTLNGTGILSGGALVNSSATPASWSGTVNLASTSSINTTGQISISGVISGTGGITKIGAEKLVLSGNNSYSGITTISTGMLQLGGSGSGSNGPLGATGGTTSLTSGACLDLNGYTLVTAESLALNGTGISSGGALINSSSTPASWSGTVTLGSASTIGTTGQITIGGVVSGGYDLTKIGGNVLVLSGSNTYTGNTLINQGTVKLGANGSGSNGPLGTIAGTTTVNDGACLDLNGYSLTTAENLTLFGSGIGATGALLNSSGTTSNWSGVVTLSSATVIGTSAQISLLSSTFNGNGYDLTKVGSSTLAFSASTNKSLGSLTINAGTFSNGMGSLTLSGNLSNSGTFDGSSGTLSIAGNLTNSGTFTSTSGTCSLVGSFTNNGTFTHNNGTIVLNGGVPQTISGSASPTFYSLTLNNALGLSLSVSATVNGTLTLTLGRIVIGDYDLNLASTGTISGAFDSNKMIVTNGAGKLVKILSSASFTFPVGTGTTDYSPLTLSSLTGYTGKSIGVSVVNGKHPSNASSTYFLNRYWSIRPSATGITGSVTGTYLIGDLSGGDVSKVAAGRYFSTGTPNWTKFGALTGTTLTSTSTDLGSLTSNTCFTGITLAAPTASVTYNPGQNVLCGSALTLTAAPVGDSPFTYLWTNNAETTAAITPSTSTLGSASGSLTVTDANGFTVNQGYSYTVNAIQVDATLGTPTGFYTTLGNAFASINNGTHKGSIVAKIGFSTTETTTAVLNASGSGLSNYTSVLLYPINPDITVSGSTINGPLVSFNGADNVSINGSLLQTNAYPVLTFLNSNTGTNASTILFSNDACNNTVSYCKLQGQGASATTGIVSFSTSATLGNGNDGNTIANNWITGTGLTSATRPYNAIYSTGTLGRENNNNTIANNRIYNFLNPGNETNGIRIDNNSTRFTISGNSFYGESALTPTQSVIYRAIYLNNTSGVFNVQNNYIGGSAERASGTWTKNNNFNNEFYGIYMNASSDTASNIDGNVIRNMSFSNYTLATWAGIYIQDGKAKIGTAAGDTIGSGLGTGSILVTNTAIGGSVYGIYVNSNDSVYIQNNVLGSITAANSNGANSTHLYGIYKADVAGALIITNNSIGGPTTPNSLIASSAATGNIQYAMGIYSGSTTSTLVQNNEISNLTNGTSGNGNNLTRGMRINGGMDGSLETSGGSNTILGNTIHDISSNSGNGSNYVYCQLVGIDVLSTNPGTTQLLRDNKIFSLTNTINNIKIEMYGIFLRGSSTDTHIIDRNLIHTFNIISNTTAYLHGISVETGACKVTNNVVYLGSNITTGCSIWGLWTNSQNMMEFYHNTVYLTGTASTGTSNSFAIRDLATGASLQRVIMNNILWNERSNTNNNTIHYSLYIGGGGSYTINYNDYQYTQRFALVNGTTYSTFTQLWGNSYDANSLNVNPLLTNKGGSLASDYQPGRSLPCVKLPSEVYDFGYIERTDSATMGAWEFAALPVEIWKGSLFMQGYVNLKSAFDAINAGSFKGGLTVKIKANTTETASAVLYQNGYNSTSSYSYVTIHPTRTEIQVKGGFAAPLIDLNGATNVRFDGRANLLGTTAHLMLINTLADNSATTLRFINGAKNDTIQYCYLKGASPSATNGIVVFSTDATVGSTGNDNNIISNCQLTNPGTIPTARVINAIYSLGTVGRENSGNVISNNLFYDFRSLSTSSNGILIGSNSSNFTISGNSFYQTATMAITTGVTLRAISIDNTSGDNFTISGNYIGGTAQQCQGSRLDIGTTSNQPIVFQPIYLNVGTGTATSVQGNTISNFQCYSTSTAPFVGIYLNAGSFNVGTLNGNILGSGTGTGNILLSGSMTSLAASYGIYVNTTAATQIKNNDIAAITTSNSNSTVNGHSFYGIYKPNATGNVTISDNIVGSLTTAQSVLTSSSSTSDAQLLAGIYCLGNGNTQIAGNTVANLKNGSTSSNAANSIYGIWLQNNGTARDSINRNFICTLSHGATAASNSITAGIYLSGGFTRVSNNIVVLGNAETYTNYLAGNGEAYYNYMVGIFDAGVVNQNSQIYHNTSYITGKNTNAVVSSAFYKPNNNVGTSDIRNNIFCNNSTGTTAKTFAMYFGSSTGSGTLTVNYNDYYTTGSVTGFYGGSTKSTKTIVTGQDVNSVITNPSFSNAYYTDRTGYRQTVDLYGTPLNVYIDHGSYVRSLTSPCLGAWERINKWKGGTSTNFNIAGNWTFNQVPAPGDNVIFEDAPLRPCLMDQERTVNNIINGQSSYRFVLNGQKLNLLGALSFTNGAQLDATATGSTLNFTGASVQSLPAGSLYNNTVYNLNLNNNANVAVSGDVLHVLGALTKQSTGRLDAISTSASLYFDGLTAQEIPADFFKDDKVYNLRIGNTSNVALSGTLKLVNQFTVTAGRLDAFTNSPTFQFEGSAAQTMEPNCFLNERIYNLINNNSAGLTINGHFIVNNNMGILAGTVTLPETKTLTVSGTLTNSVGNNGLLLKSSALGTASLIQANDGVPATMQRYIAGDSLAWHFMSAPVSNQSISGNWTPPGKLFGGIGYDLFVWDEPSSCWVYKPNTTEPVSWTNAHPESNFVSGRGYLYAIESMQQTNSFVGLLNGGTVSRALTTSSDSVAYKGFNLLGNPYPSSIDWRIDAGFNRNMLSVSGGGYDIWTWSTLTNNYGVYNSNDADEIGTNNVTSFIAPMQAFFVKASSPGTFSFNNTARVHDGASVWLKSSNGNSRELNVRLSVTSPDGSDEVKFGFGYAANEGGAEKLFSPVPTAPSLYMRWSGRGYTTRRLTDSSRNTYVPVNFKAGVSGSYTMNCNYDASALGTIYLQDRLTGAVLDLSGGESYTFQATTTDASERFVLHFGAVTPVDSDIHPNVWVSAGVLNVYLENMIGDYSMRISDLQGRQIQNKKMSGSEQCSVSLFGRGVYLVTVSGMGKQHTIKVVY